MATPRSDSDTLSRAETEALERARRRVGEARGEGTGRSAGARNGRRAGHRSARPARRRSGRSGRPPARSATLDLLRGLGVAASVVLLAGSAPARLPPWATPSAWHGYRAADLVLPLFLVAAGASLAQADARRRGAPRWRRVGRLVRRTVVLLAVGFALSWLAGPELAQLRWTGLLQRIALASLVGWGLTRLPRSWQVASVLAVLTGWWWALERVPVPGAVSGALTPTANIARWVDVRVLGPEHVVAPTDPLGLATTLPAALLVVAGIWLGDWLRDRPTGPATATALAVAGGWSVVLGVVWGQVTPLNATLWTPSYVLFAAGVTLVVTAAAYLAVEVVPGGRVLAPIQVLGRNALVAYALPAGVVAALSRPGPDGGSAWARSVERFTEPVFGELGGLVVAAVALSAVWWVATALDRRGWHLRA